MKIRSFVVTALAGWIALRGGQANGQIPLSSGAYSNNFDALGASGGPWVNNVTLPGWYATRGSSDFTNYLAGTGSSTTGGLYSFGVNGVNPPSDRALGSLASAATATIFFGVRFTNDTPHLVTNITVSYTGEQWRSGSSTTAQALSFAWRVAAAPITNLWATGNWSNFPALNFVSPNLSGSSSALDGNAAANRQVFSNVLLSGVSVAPGEELVLRWQDVDDVGTDNALAIDDLLVTFSELAPPPTNFLSTNTISLLTWNVKGNGATNWSTNAPQVRAIARKVQHLNPDIITFQEIPFDLSYEMTNFINAFLPGWWLARNSGTDGAIRSIIASRFPITRSTSWLDGIDLRAFGYSNANNALDNFTRDLFEAEIAVPGFARPLHVFTVHLKATSGTTYEDAAAKRAAEAAAITNFFATNLFVHYPYDPYVLTGDLNDSDTNALAIQRLLSPLTGLKLTNPRNPVTGSINTFSIQGTLNSRLDYILPNALLWAHVQTGFVFRTDLLNPLPPNLFSNDSATASDHLPVMLVIRNPYDAPFRITSVTRSNANLVLEWESVFGQAYRLETSTNLTTWTVAASNLVATTNRLSHPTSISGDARWYRVRRTP
ncbi:MAG: endonuclease/exonuclease/phosphatase family protein [Verrucomicrobiales bacterium]|nr:endonuclease/exonuclease/phosphatase family protein [Verrucomicrobiales bacterium]